MINKKKAKKYGKAVGGLMVGGIGLGYGIQAASGTGLTGAAGTAAGHAATGMGKVAGKMPMMGSIIGAGMVIDSVKGLQKSANFKKKKSKW